MSDSTTVDLLRHGEPEGGQKFRGALDDPLSPRGWEQLRTAVGKSCDWQAIVSSPLIRCAAFAQELAERLRRPLEIVPDFRELHFGSWEGRTSAEIDAADPLALQRFWRDPVIHPIPGGEPIAAFDRRVSQAWDALLKRYQGQHVLLVAHGGSIRMVLRRVLDMPLRCIWRFEIPYAALSRIRQHTDLDAEPQLIFHNGQRA
ncbi:MAG: alpha-ribazole phosphatase family protein [Candidatus Competibacteraceae bacterium]